MIWIFIFILQYATQNFGVRPATVPAAAAPLQVHPPPSMMQQPWNMAPSGPLQTGQTGQQNSLTVNSILVSIYLSGCWICGVNGFNLHLVI